MTDGERWAQELLVELRAARFAPAAWVRFLARSFARAREQRARHRRAHRQALLLGASGLLAWSVVALAGRPVLAAAGAGWWLLVVLMLDWHLGMIERPGGRPLEGLGAANVLSVLRAGIVPALFVLSPTLLATALLAAWATDVLDGQLARSRDEVTRLGLWLDGTVDGFVLAGGAIALARSGLLPAWVAAVAVARHALPWLAAALYLARAELPGREALVSGRVPGLLLLAGLTLAAFGSAAGPPLAVAGALGGIGSFAATVARSRRAATIGAAR